MRRNTVRTVSEATPLLQYANGKTNARSAPSARFTPLVGFHIQTDRDPVLDNAAARANFPRIEIKHQRPGGAEILEHWYFGDQIAVFPITEGPPADTMSGCLQLHDQTASAGIGVRWDQGDRSRLTIWVIVKALLPHYTSPLRFSFKSRMTDEMLRALVAHVRMCEIADTMIDRNRHPDPVFCHELALPLGVGEEAEWGKGETATISPITCRHPPEEQIDLAYLRTIWRSDAVHMSAQEHWPSIQAMARAFVAEHPLEEAA